MPIYIFIDFDANTNGENIHEYTNVIDQFRNDYPSVTICLTCRTQNFGLRKNILEGLNFVAENSDAFIVFEDDIAFNANTIEYFLASLNRYKHTDVFHLNGWCHPNWYPFKRNNYFFSKWAFCWGWATWSEKWGLLQLDAYNLLKRLENREYEFNIYGSYLFTDQLRRNLNQTLSSWAIFWTSTIFINGGRCLTPSSPHCKPLQDDKFTNAANISAYEGQSIRCTFDETKLPIVSEPFDKKEIFILFVYVRFIHRIVSTFGRLKGWFSR